MIKPEFKRFLIKTLEIEPSKVRAIEDYISTNFEVRQNAESIEYPDGSTFYSQKYVERETKQAYLSGQICFVHGPVIHKAELVKANCPNCQFELVK